MFLDTRCLACLSIGTFLTRCYKYNTFHINHLILRKGL